MTKLWISGVCLFLALSAESSIAGAGAERAKAGFDFDGAGRPITPTNAVNASNGSSFWDEYDRKHSGAVDEQDDAKAKRTGNYFDRYDNEKPAKDSIDSDTLRTRTEVDGQLTPGGARVRAGIPEGALEAIQAALGGVVLAGVCAFLLWKLAGGYVQGAGWLPTGRRWFNLTVSFASFAALTRFLSAWFGAHGTQSIAAISAMLVVGLLGAVLLGLVAFAGGAATSHVRSGGRRGEAAKTEPAEMPMTLPSQGTSTLTERPPLAPKDNRTTKQKPWWSTGTPPSAGQPFIGVAVVLAVLLGWAFRWQPVPVAGDQVAVYLLNRWTGEMRLYAGTKWMPVVPRIEKK